MRVGLPARLVWLRLSFCVIPQFKASVPAQSYGAKYVVGVDIDDSLIQGAWRRRRAVWSRQQPTPIRSPSLQEGSLLAGEQSPGPPIKPGTNYFPASCEYEFGSLPTPPSEHRGKETFPHNLTFRTADWVKTTIPEDKDGYDVVVAYVLSRDCPTQANHAWVL